MTEEWEISKHYGDEIVLKGTDHTIIEVLGGVFVGEEHIVPVETAKRAALAAAAPDLSAALWDAYRDVVGWTVKAEAALKKAKVFAEGEK
jgi:hypothetical protein